MFIKVFLTNLKLPSRPYSISSIHISHYDGDRSSFVPRLVFLVQILLPLRNDALPAAINRILGQAVLRSPPDHSFSLLSRYHITYI